MGRNLQRSTSTRQILAIASLLALAALPATADIFQRHPAYGLCKGLGFTEAYSAPVQVNGGKAKMDVWASSDRFFRTMTRLEQACEAKGWPGGFTAGKSIGFGMALDGDLLIRWLVTRIEDGGKESAIVYQTSQALSEFQKGAAPTEHRLTQLPLQSNSTPLSYIHDDNTRTRIEVSRSNQVSEFVQVWYDREMKQAGWASGVQSRADARIYVRGSERAMIAIRNDEQRRAIITRVYKQSTDVK